MGPTLPESYVAPEPWLLQCVPSMYFLCSSPGVCGKVPVPVRAPHLGESSRGGCFAQGGLMLTQEGSPW